jgi:TolB-like protein
MKSRLVRVSHLAREYLTHWSIAGAIIAATGAAPEHWLAELVHGLHVPHGIVPDWLATADYRVVAVVGGVGIIVGDTLWRNHRRTQHASPAPELPDRPSIVVLPFQNMSGDPEQEYFADGMAVDITTSLSRIRWLFVIARNSAFAYKGHQTNLEQIGRELQVRYVLEGSVRRVGDNVRITGQLIEAETSHQIWADRFDGNLADIFKLQDRVTEAVAQAIAPNVRNAEFERARRKPPNNLGAYDLYLRALFLYYQLSRESSDEALHLLRRSLALDPNYAPTLALTALHISYRSAQGWMSDGETLNEAISLARKALMSDPNDSDVAAMSARVLAYAGHAYEEAIATAKHAIELNPYSAYVIAQCGWVHQYAGRFREAIEYFEASSRMDPHDPMAYSSTAALALSFLGVGDSARQSRQPGGRSSSAPPSPPPGAPLPHPLPWRENWTRHARQRRSCCGSTPTSPSRGLPAARPPTSRGDTISLKA